MLSQLTRRQTEIYNYVLKGLSIEEIAKLRDITPNGVKFHLTKIYHAFGVTNRTELLSKVLWEQQERNDPKEFTGLPLPKNKEVVINAD